MPDRVGVDDDADLLALIALWRDGSADLDSRVAQIEREIRTELARGDRIAVGRLRLAARRLEGLIDVAAMIVDDLVDGTDRWIQSGGMTSVYTAGAERLDLPFSFTLPHRAAVEVLAADTFSDVLVLADVVDQDARRWVRQVGRRLTSFSLTGGVTPRQAAKRLERELSAEFRRRGMGAITYADGSRHSFGEYAEMLLRTKTTVAYNAGTMNQGRLAGIRFYEILDGSLCGLTSHDDPELANGLIVPFEVASAFPLAHPNCRRALNARPDITEANRADAVSVQSVEARADQTAFEEALRQQQREGRRRTQRARRASRSSRDGRDRRTRQRRPRRATRASRG